MASVVSFHAEINVANFGRASRKFDANFWRQSSEMYVNNPPPNVSFLYILFYGIPGIASGVMGLATLGPFESNRNINGQFRTVDNKVTERCPAIVRFAFVSDFFSFQTRVSFCPYLFSSVTASRVINV